MKVVAQCTLLILLFCCISFCSISSASDSPQSTDEWDYQMKVLKNSLYGRKSISSDLGLPATGKYEAAVKPKAVRLFRGKDKHFKLFVLF